MWNDLLLQIEQIEKRYSGGLKPPAACIDIDNLKKRVREKFSVNLPEQYIRFLRTNNGLDFNGLKIYGVDSSLLENAPSDAIYGFIETNEVWYENIDQKQYLFFGDDDISWYCLNISKGTYEIRDKPSGTLMEIAT